MCKVLKKCIELGISKTIALSYNSNITELPEEVLDLWTHFKEVKLLCSVDGFEKVNDYIRPPSRWRDIDANLRYLDLNAKKYNLTEILISCTVQVYNVLFLNDLYEYVNQFKNIIPALNLINLKYPEFLSTQVLPVPAKILAKLRLEKVKENISSKVPTVYNYLIENIDQVIKNMEEEDLSFALFKFKNYDLKINEISNMKIKDYLPELNCFLVDYFFEAIENITNKK